MINNINRIKKVPDIESAPQRHTERETEAVPLQHSTGDMTVDRGAEKRPSHWKGRN